MGSQRILPSTNQLEKETILIHRNGEIISIKGSVYQVKLYSEPNRKIFTTSIDRALDILSKDSYDYTETDFYYKEKFRRERI